MLSVGCNAATSAPATSTADVPSQAPTGNAGVDGPCADRPHCVVRSSESIDGLPNARLVKTLVAAAGTAPSEGECERREYWLTDDARRTLLAADCAAQYGADSQGPADVQLAGNSLTVRYIEFQEDDRCELVDATINLVAIAVERQDRRVGRVSQDRCIPEKPHNVMPPVGDGSIGKPLLVLHRG